MTALARLQRGFQRNVLEGNPRFERHVVPTARVSAKRRLAIYSAAYRARLVEALGKDYPGLRAFAGEAQFERLARDYIADHPSQFPNLRWYGGEFATFLRAGSSRRGPALADMANFEWQLGLAFDAADITPLTIENLARVAPEDWPHLRFTAHPSVRMLRLRYNVPAIVAAVQDDKSVPPLKRTKAPVFWLLWRQDLTAHFRSLQADEARALGALIGGADFGEICAEFSDGEDPALRAAALLKRWIIDGLIASTRMRDS